MSKVELSSVEFVIQRLLRAREGSFYSTRLHVKVVTEPPWEPPPLGPATTSIRASRHDSAGSVLNGSSICS